MEFVLFAVSMIGLLWLRSRVRELEEARVESAAAEGNQIALLTRRVFALEQLASAPAAGAGEPAEPEGKAPAPAPAAPVLTVPVEVEPVVAAPPRVEPVCEAPPIVEAPAFVEAVEAARPSAFRQALASHEWETLVGGSILNAIGGIVLVIGIALFLAYSLAHMTAVGRASLAATTSFAILGTGVWVERKPRYRIFARGLIGAGWAALYATAYAIYAIPAARILPNAVVGSLILLAVALGMVAHSLRYRAQAVTLVAYAAVFASLAVTPSSPFAVVSLVPIAASVLYLAAKFEWDSMPLFGLLATYLTCISRGESDASLASTESLFLAYWLLFELFDLRRVKRGLVSGGLEFLFPLNAAGFLGLSYLAWSHHAPDRLWFAAACGSALFLASSIARAVLRRGVDGDAAEFFARLQQGSYEASLIVASLLGVLGIVGRAPGIWAVLGLALEAEALYLAGVRFKSGFVRGLGTGLFSYSLGRLTFTTAPGGTVAILGHRYADWTPAVVFHAALFYLNRAIRRPAVYFSYAAAALIAVVLFADAAHAFLGLAWVVFGCLLLEFGLFRRLAEFRIQAYCLIAAGVFTSCAYPVANPHGPWGPLAATLALVYVCAVQAGRSRAFDFRGSVALAGWLSCATAAAGATLLWRTVPVEYAALAWMALALGLFELGVLHRPAQLRFALGPLTLLAVTGVLAEHYEIVKDPSSALGLTYIGLSLGAWLAAAQLTLWTPGGAHDWETRGLRDGLTAVGTMAALTASWMYAPDDAVAIVWIGVALALLEAGALLREGSFYVLALGTMAAVYMRVFAWDIPAASQWAGLPECTLPVALTIAATYWMWRRFQLFADFQGARNVIRGILWAPPVVAFCAIAWNAADAHIALGVAAIALAFETAGGALDIDDLKWQARILALGGFAWACFFDVDPPQLAISIPTAAIFYAAQFAAHRSNEKRAGLYFSLLGTVLAGAILYGRSSGELLTVAWGLLGLSLLGAGFATRERGLRLQGLSLFLICILKLFLYDLRNLETLYRILSFVALGLILLSVSWIYSRFREQVERLL